MRSTTILLIAGALGAAPAAAQNTTVDANTIAANNVIVADPANMTATAPVNGLTTGPGTPADTAGAMPPATGQEGNRTADRGGGGIPWGLVGLVGLVGLLGRRRRDG